MYTTSISTIGMDKYFHTGQAVVEFQNEKVYIYKNTLIDPYIYINFSLISVSYSKMQCNLWTSTLVHWLQYSLAIPVCLQQAGEHSSLVVWKWVRAGLMCWLGFSCSQNLPLCSWVQWKHRQITNRATSSLPLLVKGEQYWRVLCREH